MTNEERNRTLYVATTFDHEILSNGIHMWLMRRWNAFHVASNSIVALGLAHVFARVFSIPQSYRWTLTTLVVGGLLAAFAVKAWREVMGMIEFQSLRTQGNAGKDENPEESISKK